ncbi:MAG: SDR family oxidoreductase [Thiohalocapsa sp. PB-PSB1]|jgi:NAD(P)-dependent dehydrogenase (short-subunit alcohol dehydrogenase family)|nr:MAG: SDR family oxidoreductase [Thiohalocapsa sp. PB-PSB1]
MSNDNQQPTLEGLTRRDFMMASAAGTAGLAATGLGIGTAAAAPTLPPQLGEPPRTNSPSGIRTAIVTDTQLNMGPYIAEEFAKRGYNLVIADVKEGLPEKLRELGAKEVVIVPGIEQEAPNDEGRPGVIQTVVDAAMDKFGGYDSVFIRTAWHGGKDILEETTENMQLSYNQNCLGVMYALQAVLPPLIAGGGGQVVVQTSATGEKPHPGLMSYSVMRAAANMMCRCAALTVADKNVCVNAIGTNFMNYPGFKHTLGADKDPKIMEALLEEIPIGRLGETREAAHFAMALLDGYNMYTTGSFFPVAGGFNNVGM